MVRDNYLQHLASVRLFSNCTNRELEEIGKVADELVIPSGTTLIRQGEIGVELYILIDGTASVIHDGKQIASVTSGDVVGEMSVISGQPRNVTVLAETDLHALILSRAGFDQLLDDIPGLAKHLLYEVTARLLAISPGVAQ